MKKTTIPKDFDNQKFINFPDGTIRYQISRRTLYGVAEKAGAIRKIGRRVLIDKETLDAYLDSQATEQ